MIVTAEELAAIHAQAVREYPHESCGIILTRGSGAARDAVPEHPGGAARQGSGAASARCAHGLLHRSPGPTAHRPAGGAGIRGGGHLPLAHRRRRVLLARPTGARRCSGTSQCIPRPRTSWPRCAEARAAPGGGRHGRLPAGTRRGAISPPCRWRPPALLGGAGGMSESRRLLRAARGPHPRRGQQPGARIPGVGGEPVLRRARPRARGFTTSTAGATSTSSAPGGR